VLNGIVKIASKMGISTIQSYQSSQIFEAVGISKDVIDKYFTGTVSRVGGIGLEDIQADVEAAHNAAFDPLGLDINMELADGGAHKFRSGKEEHLFTPQTIHLFQKACFTGDYKAFKDFTRTVDNMGAEGVHLRSLLDFSYDPNGGIRLDFLGKPVQFLGRDNDFRFSDRLFGIQRLGDVIDHISLSPGMISSTIV
jgi:glutamate synthase (ferredoxin)